MHSIYSYCKIYEGALPLILNKKKLNIPGSHEVPSISYMGESICMRWCTLDRNIDMEHEHMPVEVAVRIEPTHNIGSYKAQ